MKHYYTFLFALLLSITAGAQPPFWVEEFGTGCNRGQQAGAYTGMNGSWAVSSTGQNDTYADVFYVSATASGSARNNCSDNCIFSNTTNQSLHIGNSEISMFVIGGDTGSTYLTGVTCGFGICSMTHKRAESPLINCSGHTNVTIEFLYYEGGEGSDDNATLEYSPDGGATWTVIDQLAKTLNNCPAPSGLWTHFTATLPGTADNNASVKIGFQWTNDNDGQGGDPSFAVDSIALYDGGLGNVTLPVRPMSVYAAGSTIVIEPGTDDYRVLSVNDVLGRTINAPEVNNRISVPNGRGVYFVTLEVNGKRVVKKLLLNE